LTHVTWKRHFCAFIADTYVLEQPASRILYYQIQKLHVFAGACDYLDQRARRNGNVSAHRQRHRTASSSRGLNPIKVDTQPLAPTLR
jgi:hypothetical protein